MELQVVAIFCLLVSVHGGTWFYPATEVLVHGVPVTYCTHKSLNVLPGAKFTDYDSCETCTCSEDGLHCNTALVVGADDPESSQCIPVYVACEPRWVMRNDNTQPCPNNLMPTKVWAKGK